jgi:hypothetical protein
MGPWGTTSLPSRADRTVDEIKRPPTFVTVQAGGGGCLAYVEFAS